MVVYKCYFLSKYYGIELIIINLKITEQHVPRKGGLVVGGWVVFASAPGVDMVGGLVVGGLVFAGALGVGMVGDGEMV